jgi:hypothetical protein
MTKPTRSNPPTSQDPPDSEPAQPYNPYAIFDEDGPIHPSFMREAVRTLMRTMPLDPVEPPAWAHRRMHSAMLALAALHPRDEIEIMLGVQALCAFHAAAVGWYLGMNQTQPPGSGLRHIAAAASAARTFDTLLRALERRQAKPLSVPPGRPAPRCWPALDTRAFMADWEQRCAGEPADDPVIEWTPEAIAVAEEMLTQDRIAAENEGLDLANTEGILPGGGMIMPEDPTPQQLAYLARRNALRLKREYAENRRRGINTLPKIRPIRPGDFIP